ncbi:MAG: hypothetical protein IIU66_04930, partial [Clostridia bacterium]|nr:hypothetical protein [Clostridia bacterium]
LAVISSFHNLREFIKTPIVLADDTDGCQNREFVFGNLFQGVFDFAAIRKEFDSLAVVVHLDYETSFTLLCLDIGCIVKYIDFLIYKGVDAYLLTIEKHVILFLDRAISDEFCVCHYFSF